VSPGDIGAILERLKALAPSHIAPAGYAPAETLAGLAAFAASAGLPPDAGAAELARGVGGLVTRLTGAALIGIGALVPGLVARAGIIAGPGPDAEALERGKAALERARRYGLKDVGQALVALPDGRILEEDAAGTDALLERVGALGCPGGILAKAAKPQQPLFADMPVVGPTTIARAAAAGIALIALEAGRVLIVGLPEVEIAAARAGIGLVGY
jgi:DUF1009 family protein